VGSVDGGFGGRSGRRGRVGRLFDRESEERRDGIWEGKEETENGGRSSRNHPFLCHGELADTSGNCKACPSHLPRRMSTCRSYTLTHVLYVIDGNLRVLFRDDESRAYFVCSEALLVSTHAERHTHCHSDRQSETSEFNMPICHLCTESLERLSVRILATDMYKPRDPDVRGA
jgi:hypothetical protein